MRPLTLPLLGALLALPAVGGGGCASYSTHVDSDLADLGRVVVYQNGIAYRERRALVRDQALTLTVPHDKVDDFLKSLSVVDAASGETLPVSYPTRGATRDGQVDMTVQVPGVDQREVVLTYITEAPAWKPSYRVVLGDDGDVTVRGWAIVDNTSGEDWRDVRVGVGSSSALSFRYDLRSVRLVERQTLHGTHHVAVAPPTGGGAFAGERDAKVVLAELGDKDVPRPDGHPEMMPQRIYDFDDDLVDEDELQTTAASRSGAAAGGRVESRDEAVARQRIVARARERQLEQQRRVAKNSEAKARVQQLAKRLNDSGGDFVIEGYAGATEPDADKKSEDRAHNLRAELIRAGVDPGRIQVRGLGSTGAPSGGVRLVRAPAASESPADTPAPADDGTPVGESHFESEGPMTVERGTSAMVAILDAKAKGDSVYLFDPEGQRGNRRFAFKAVRFANPTDSTLEMGPVTVYGRNRFVGEGLTNPIPPSATAVIPYALDRQVRLERSQESEDRMTKLVTLQRGVLTTEIQHRRTTVFKVHNRLRTATTLYLRHRVGKGWALIDHPRTEDRFGEEHLFVVALPANETIAVRITEATPMTRTIDLRSPTGMSLVKVYLQGTTPNEAFAGRVAGLLDTHAAIDDLRQAIRATRQRAGEYRARSSELEGQLVELGGLKGGRRLSRHLQKKLQDMSDRIQQATLDVVDQQEQLMLARIRFQDGVADLTLTPAQLSGEQPVPEAGDAVGGAGDEPTEADDEAMRG